MMRSFQKADVDQVCSLHRKVFHEEPMMSRRDLAQHFLDVFFEIPARTGSEESLVWADRAGTIKGFMGVFLRRMVVGDDAITVAVPTQLMVDPDCPDAFIAHRFVRELFNSGHDLVISDGATTPVSRLWEAHGGETLKLLSFRWLRPVRPAQEMVASIRRFSRYASSVITVTKPLLMMADAVFSRVRPNRFQCSRDELKETQLTPNEYHQVYKMLASRENLRCIYDAASVERLFNMLETKERFGRLIKKLLRNDDGDPVGWYLYYARRGGIAEVVEVRARRDQRDDVLMHLFRDAWKAGAIGVRGNVQPNLLLPLSELHARFHIGAPWFVAYSKRKDVMEALHKGDTLLSRMDLEFPLHFIGG